MDNLNAQLQPLNAPVSQNEEIANSYTFDYGNERNAIAQSKISFISADKIAAGTVIVSINVGSSSGPYLLIDGPNNRILVNDGTTNRIVIGSV